MEVVVGKCWGMLMAEYCGKSKSDSQTLVGSVV